MNKSDSPKIPKADETSAEKLRPNGAAAFANWLEYIQQERPRQATIIRTLYRLALLSQELQELTKLVAEREPELMEANEIAAFARTVRKTAEELSAAAATWARVSDSIRERWGL
jgi:hypothetical protein